MSVGEHRIVFDCIYLMLRALFSRDYASSCGNGKPCTDFDESRRMATTQYAFCGFFFVKYSPHLPLAPHPKSTIIDMVTTLEI